MTASVAIKRREYVRKSDCAKDSKNSFVLKIYVAHREPVVESAEISIHMVNFQLKCHNTVLSVNLVGNISTSIVRAIRDASIPFLSSPAKAK